MTAPQSPVEVLRAARKLIEKPESWTQGAFARDGLGTKVEATARDAVCFCSSGAIFRAGYGDRFTRQTAHSFLQRVMAGSVLEFNDSRSYAEVLDAFDRAIALAEQSIPSTTVNALDAGKVES